MLPALLVCLTAMVLAPAAVTRADGVSAGLRLLLAGDLDQARVRFGDALAHDPSRAVAVAGLAAVSLVQGQSKPALSSFRSAAALAPGKAWPQACLGSAQLLGGEAAAAVESFRRALVAKPGWARVEARLAYALLCAGKGADALATARTAVNLGDKMVAPLVEAAAQLKLGDAAGAAKCLADVPEPEQPNFAALTAGLPLGYAAPSLRLASLASLVPGIGTEPATETTGPAVGQGGVSITWPHDDTIVRGRVEVRVSFTSPPAYSVLYVDDKFCAVTNAAQPRTSWDTRRWPDGAHRLRVDAYDRDGRCTGRCEVRVVVSNRERTANAAQEARDDALGMVLAGACLFVPPPWDAPLLRAETARERGQPVRALDVLEPAFAAWPWHAGLRDEILSVTKDLGIADPQPAEILMLPRPHEVAVTFDDGPHPRITPWLLRVLAKRHIRATFFLVGKQCVEYPQLVRDIVAAGNEVGVHSYTHRNMDLLSRPEIERELVEGRWAIYRACGRRPTLFRPPGGHYSADVRAATAALGFRTVFWTADNLDFKNRSLDGMVSGLLDQLSSGGILLMHNGDDDTPLIVERVLDELQARGFKLGPVGELTGLSSPYLALGGGGQALP